MAAWTFEAIGTRWQVDTGSPIAPDVRHRVSTCIDDFDRTWSRFRDDSLITQLSRRGGTGDLGADGVLLLDFYDELHRVTAGAVNPLVGRTLSDLGYDADYSLTPATATAAVPPWSTLLRDGSSVSALDPVLLDVGAAGKGLLVDVLAGVLAAAGLLEITIDASGDIHHGGTAPMAVALEHPADPTRALGVVDLPPGHAVCGSATNRRAWGSGLHHVLDARTGRPTTDVVATWVISAQSCMVADGLSTAHFFADPDRLLERWDHQFVRVHADGRVVWSPDLPGEVFA